MSSQIQIHHRQKMAYVYLRQSTMAQVLHHQESTQRQYALKDRALDLGWPPDQIRVLDADLGISGTQASNRVPSASMRKAEKSDRGRGGWAVS